MAARGAGSTSPRRAACSSAGRRSSVRAAWLAARILPAESNTTTGSGRLSMAAWEACRAWTTAPSELCSNSARRSAMALKSAARDAISSVPSTRARAAKSFSPIRRAACVKTLRGRRASAMAQVVGGLLEEEEPRLQLAEIGLGRGRVRLVGKGGDACGVVFPPLAQFGGHFLLSGLGDVAFLDLELRFEGAAVVGDLHRRLLGVAGHDEQDGAVDAFRRFLHALGGEHAAVVRGEDVLGGGA